MDLAPVSPLPLLLTVAEFAELLGWERRRAHRLLEGLGILQEMPIKQKNQQRFYVDRNDLREKCPPAYKELERRRETGDLPVPQRRPSKASSSSPLRDHPHPSNVAA